MGVQLANRASTEIVLSFDQVIVRYAGFFEVVNLDRIVALLVCSSLSRSTYLLTEKQISKKGCQFGFGGCY
jgi:hypothetical protein